MMGPQSHWRVVPYEHDNFVFTPIPTIQVFRIWDNWGVTLWWLFGAIEWWYKPIPRETDRDY